MPFRYTGQRYFSGLNLYYYKARFYSPALGRFLQTDPIGTQDGLNLYAYVGNNPINFVDPSGLAATDLGLAFDKLGESAGGQVVQALIPGSDLISTIRNPDSTLGDYAIAGIATALPVAKALRVVGSLADVAGGKIFRAASGTPASLTPKPKDIDSGLSAANSLENSLPGKNQVIDTSKLNKLCAFCDNPKTGHISILPKDKSQMQDWIDSRGSSTIHPLTQELMDAVVDTVTK